MYKEVENNKVADMVFLALFVKESKPYMNHENEDLKLKNYPRVFLVDRYDSKKGFIGGNMDKGKTEIDTLKCEFIEEVGHHTKVIERINKDAIIFSCVESEQGDIIKCYKMEITEDELMEISKKVYGVHHECEVIAKGGIQVHSKNILLKEFAKPFMAGSSWQELQKLVKEEKLMEISNVIL